MDILVCLVDKHKKLPKRAVYFYVHSAITCIPRVFLLSVSRRNCFFNQKNAPKLTFIHDAPKDLKK